MNKSAEQTIIQQASFPETLDYPVMVACSGGPDSMALLHFMCRHFSPQQIVCAHFDHRWSSSSSKASQLVEDFCSEQKITCVVGKAESMGQSSEAKARELRYEFLQRKAGELGCKSVFTAHHREDQLETFLFRLLRGSGPMGLECMQKERHLSEDIKLIRPLLNLRKADLLNYCEEQRLSFYQDPSNEQLEIKRNLIRKQLMPLMEKIQPDSSKRVIEFMQLLQEQNEIVKLQFADLERDYFQRNDKFTQQPKAMQRLIIKELIQENRISPSFTLIESLRQKIESNESFKVTLSPFVHFLSDGITFHLSHNRPREEFFTFQDIVFTLQDEFVAPVLNNKRFAVSRKVLPISEVQKQANAYSVLVNLSKFENQQLALRKRQPKDVFQPLGVHYKCKLKKFLIDRKARHKFNLQEGATTLVLCVHDSSEVLWIPGLEISDSIKVTDHSTHLLEFI